MSSTFNTFYLSFIFTYLFYLTWSTLAWFCACFLLLLNTIDFNICMKISGERKRTWFLKWHCNGFPSIIYHLYFTKNNWYILFFKLKFRKMYKLLQMHYLFLMYLYRCKFYTILYTYRKLRIYVVFASNFLSTSRCINIFLNLCVKS